MHTIISFHICTFSNEKWINPYHIFVVFILKLWQFHVVFNVLLTCIWVHVEIKCLLGKILSYFCLA